MSALDDKKAYDYSGGWFKSDINLSSDKIPVGDYKVYVRVTNGEYQAKSDFTNISYKEMTRRAKGDNREFYIEVDYGTINTPLLFSIRDTLIGSSTPQTPVSTFIFLKSINADNGLYIKGTSNTINVSYNNLNEIERYIIFENTETFKRYSYKLNNNEGDYLITLAVSDNCDKKYAWFEINIPRSEIDNMDKGKYVIYISEKVGNETFYGEIQDISYKDLTDINNKLGHELFRNDNLRSRIELNVK